MGIRYSQLPKDNAPTTDDWVAILDNHSATLKTTTIEKLVRTMTGDTDIGTASLEGIGDGTVTGAISFLANSSSTLRIYALTQAQYDELPTSVKNDGNLRFITETIN